MQFNSDQGTNRLRVGYVLLCPTIHRVSLNAPVDIHSCSRLSRHAHTVIRALTHPHTLSTRRKYTRSQTARRHTHGHVRERTLSQLTQKEGEHHEDRLRCWPACCRVSVLHCSWMLSWNKSNEGWISVCPALPVPTVTLRFFTVCTVQEKKVESFIRSRVFTLFLLGFGSFLLSYIFSVPRLGILTRIMSNRIGSYEDFDVYFKKNETEEKRSFIFLRNFIFYKTFRSYRFR